MSKKNKFILWFDEIGMSDLALVGGKNASLGEMYKILSKKGVNIPQGFAVTAAAYRYFIEEEHIQEELERLFKNANFKSIQGLAKVGHEARQLLLRAELPPALRISIIDAYRKLCQKYGRNTDVAVRSSATAEDLPDASFAGQQETYLNIRGEHALLDACKKCFASLFTDRAIHYRFDKGFDHFKVSLSVGIQNMVRSDLGASGVMFSIDTESGFRDVVLINAIYGLGENIVQGKVNPDEYYVFKPTLKKGYNSIISKTVGNKNIKMVYATGGVKRTTKDVLVAEEDRKKFVLSEDEILKLAKWACIIEDHYKKPMDMEWARDGKSGKLFVVQARPETVQSRRDVNVLEEYKIQKRGTLLTKGKSVGAKIGIGRARVIKDVHSIHEFKDGEILVTEMTDPDWEPIMKIAAGIVTNKGGRTCHAAIVSRELGIPCIVGTNDATVVISKNQKVTVSCAEGEEGFVYDGYVPFKINKHNLKSFKRPLTKVMMNVGNPEQAFESSFVPNDGVGLAREEFIINEYIKIHPKALFRFNQITDEETRDKIECLTVGYKDKTQFFIDKLAYGVGHIAAAFYPKPVIVRMSDFKSNEYANLIGGHMFEPIEHNPMIGWRGASRYYSANYREAFGLECRAMRKVIEGMGLTNVKLMIPFCRTVEEGKKVLAEMEKNGLKRGRKGLEVYVMCEIPSNVILADEFSKIFDGFSIGTNDLTQLTLGLDRDSELVSHVYDERNDAVKALVASVIQKAKANRKKIGICGEAASIPEFARFLVECGIDSVSVAPDAVIKTTLIILEQETKLKRKH
jgi:pyruvate,water dikinase